MNGDFTVILLLFPQQKHFLYYLGIPTFFSFVLEPLDLFFYLYTVTESSNIVHIFSKLNMLYQGEGFKSLTTVIHVNSLSWYISCNGPQCNGPGGGSRSIDGKGVVHRVESRRVGGN